MQTARQLADIVMNLKGEALNKPGSATAILETEKLANADESFVRQVVSQAGFNGPELEKMSAHVTQLLVGQVEALADDMPTVGGD